MPLRYVPGPLLLHANQTHRLTDAFLQPLIGLLFGNLVQDFINFTKDVQNFSPDDPQTIARTEEAVKNFRHIAARDASFLTYAGALRLLISVMSSRILGHHPPTLLHFAGVGMFICTYVYMCTWVYTSEATAKRIRERYFKAILRQDIAFFDNVGPGEVTARIQTDTRMWSL